MVSPFNLEVQLVERSQTSALSINAQTDVVAAELEMNLTAELKDFNGCVC